MTTRFTGKALVTIFVALALTVGGGAANADDLDPRIVFALEAQPGGVVTSSTTVVWPELGMELTLLPAIAPRGLSSKCPTGLVCAFASSYEGGARLTWATCGTFPTTALSSVGSIANARSTGTLQARNGTTVLVSASAGNFTNVPGYVNNVRCL